MAAEKKKNSVSIWNGQNCDQKWISEIQNGQSIWNGQKCDRFVKKFKKEVLYLSEMARNAIESEFWTLHV